MKKAHVCIFFAWAVLTGGAASAHAEFVLTPYADTRIAGDVENGRGGVGISGAYYFRGRIGLEIDVERKPHFFNDADVDSLVPVGIDMNTDATLYMGNLVAPFCFSGAAGSWCPYATAGFGVVRATFDAVEFGGIPNQTNYDRAQDNLAYNVGGGIMHALTRLVGLRVDFRYFHAFVDEKSTTGGYFKDYGFLRASVGITFGFPR